MFKQYQHKMEVVELEGLCHSSPQGNIFSSKNSLESSEDVGLTEQDLQLQV